MQPQLNIVFAIHASFLAFGPQVPVVSSKIADHSPRADTSFEHVERFLQRPPQSKFFIGSLNFKLELHQSPSGGETDSDQSVHNDRYSQHWSIWTTGPDALRCQLISTSASATETIWFGETPKAIWWTVGGELRVYEKSAIDSLRRSDAAVQLRAAEGLLENARYELDCILALDGMQLRHLDLSVKSVEALGDSLGVAALDGANESKITLDRHGDSWLVSRYERPNIAGEMVITDFGDYGECAQFLFPGWLERRLASPVPGRIIRSFYSSISASSPLDRDTTAGLYLVPSFGDHTLPDVRLKSVYDRDGVTHHFPGE